MNARTMRAAFRDVLVIKGSKPAFSRDEYRLLTYSHAMTLKKYLDAFPKFYKARFGKPWRGKVTVARIFALLETKPSLFIREFMNYFRFKTHLSYELNATPRPIRLPRRYRNMGLKEYKKLILAPCDPKEFIRQKWAEKAGEFVIMIVAEYVALHNYMWSSGLKPAGVRTIDRWMKDFTPGEMGFCDREE